MIKILYWNVRQAPENYKHLLHLNYDLLAVQEPVRPGTAPPCPTSCNFSLIYGGGRAAIYINKKLPLHSWTAKAAEDICMVDILGTRVYSIYSPTPTPGEQWISPIHDLLARPPP